jgi:formate--tetrahydrofolate ligase
MLSDVEIAAAATPAPIIEIAEALGLGPEDLHPYGRDKAKVDLSVLSRARSRSGEPKLVLVSAITPTRAGEGKTTTTIGLGQALSSLGESVCLALREPSLGPCMGVKGGATGGGYSQVLPASSINLHFTGDFHAITSAHNLLSAAIDNHIHQGNALGIDTRQITWRRVMDMNDRALRNMVVGLGGPTQGVPRETGFDITAASEVMAMLCLADDLDDLRARIDRALVAYDQQGEPVRAGSLKVTGAMLALLQEAIMPNLVQTLEGTPVMIHGGPFANIAHGCNSVIATRMAMHLADWTVTEAGFGCDLGAEKFVDIKCQGAGLDPVAVVLVATVRALKVHGGIKTRRELTIPSPDKVSAGLCNLAKHVENIHRFGKTAVVAINRFHTDTQEELDQIAGWCEQTGVPFALADHFAHGGPGAEALARVLMEVVDAGVGPLTPIYDWDQPVVDKITAVATEVYGADGIVFTAEAKADLKDIERLGFAGLPICIAKTQNSLSDNPRARGRPTDFVVTIRKIIVNAGAGFLVVMTGDIMRMPGLPRVPQAEAIDVVDGIVTGIA